MNRLRAIEVLIQALVDDFLETDSDVRSQRMQEILRQGHTGYENLHPADLVSRIYDLGLQEQDDLINEACETLEKPC